MTIIEAREAKGLSQIELSAKTHVSPTVISKLENRHAVSRTSFLRICDALGVKPDQIEGVVISQRGKQKQQQV